MRLLSLILIGILLLPSCKDKDEPSTPLIVWQLDNHETGNLLNFPDFMVQFEEAVTVLGRSDETYYVRKVQLIFGGKPVVIPLN